MCEVPGDAPGHAHTRCVWRLSCARCLQWLQTLRSVTGAQSQELDLDMAISVLCGVGFVLVARSGLRRCVQSQVHIPRWLTCACA